MDQLHPEFWRTCSRLRILSPPDDGMLYSVNGCAPFKPSMIDWMMTRAFIRIDQIVAEAIAKLDGR